MNLNQSVYLSAHHYILCFDFTCIDYNSLYIVLCDSKVLYESPGFPCVTRRTARADGNFSVVSNILSHQHQLLSFHFRHTLNCEFCNYIRCFTWLGSGNKKPCFKMGTLQRLSKMFPGKWPTWRTILFDVFTPIPILYMFRATSCSSPEESIVSIRHLVYVALWSQSDIYQMSYWYNWFSWLGARGCSKHVKNWNKYIEKNCASSWSHTRNHNKMDGQQNIKWNKMCSTQIFLPYTEN